MALVGGVGMVGGNTGKGGSRRENNSKQGYFRDYKLAREEVRGKDENPFRWGKQNMQPVCFGCGAKGHKKPECSLPLKGQDSLRLELF